MLNYDSIPPHERSLKRIVDSMREDPPVQTSGLEKPQQFDLMTKRILVSRLLPIYLVIA